MWCDKLKCTLSTDACRKRRSLKVTGKKELEFGYSLDKCKDCEQGEAVENNPDHFINRDCRTLIIKHLRTLEERGFIFKESTKDKHETIFNKPLRLKKGDINYGIRKVDYKNGIIKLSGTQWDSTGVEQDFSTSIRLRDKIKSRLKRS